ncbi:hypothetical protein BDV96DRAFT_652568 [Lophiotrema nucula]|uniref:Uncharacterized protein n=1 Tax=Lophiotrema nucula TaxID=690887 RepID=A0A6A5YMW4_9PLEO|nr:hypothetical protein BDV96DRAFT_652568 [Lophiotrema nucula]
MSHPNGTRAARSGPNENGNARQQGNQTSRNTNATANGNNEQHRESVRRWLEEKPEEEHWNNVSYEAKTKREAN